MPSHVALLRAVNLGSHNKIAMSDLHDLLDALGYRDVKTLLQSGNVVFSARKASGSDVELSLERGAAKNLGLITDFFVRTAAEWRAIVDGNPFMREAKKDPAHLVLLAMKSAPVPAAISSLALAIKGREAVEVRGSHAYAFYPDGIGRSKLSVALIERKLGTRVTGRNWNTVLKIGALLGQQPD